MNQLHVMGFALLLSAFSVASSGNTSDADADAKNNEKEYIFVAIHAPNLKAGEVVEFLTEDFKLHFPDENVEPVLYKTTNVMKALMDGYAHVGITGKRWSDKEVTMLEHKYNARPLEIPVAADAFAIVKHADNDVQSLNRADIQKAFLPNSDCAKAGVNTWQEAGSSAFDEGQATNIEGVAYAKDERLFRIFNFHIMCDVLPKQANIVESQGDALAYVSEHINALTYTAVTLADDEQDMEQVVAILDDSGVMVKPRADTVFSGQYPLSLIYYINIAPSAKKLTRAKKYIEYLTGEAAQSKLAEKGFMVLPEQIMLRNKVKLKEAEPIIANGYR